MMRKAVQQASKVSRLFAMKLKAERTLWKFDSHDVVDNFVCVSDQNIGGKSNATFTLSRQNKALFSGSLSTVIPPESGLKSSGFCSIQSRLMKKFPFGDKLIDLSEYDCIEFRVRGDGRAYLVNMKPESFRTDDLFQAYMFTRGGPDWETIRIPFRQFYLANFGYLQDRQENFNYFSSKILNIGLLLADRINGPFYLEIDNIKAVRTLMDKTRDYLENVKYKVDMDKYRKEQEELRRIQQELDKAAQ